MSRCALKAPRATNTDLQHGSRGPLDRGTPACGLAARVNGRDEDRKNGKWQSGRCRAGAHLANRRRPRGVAAGLLEHQRHQLRQSDHHPRHHRGRATELRRGESPSAVPAAPAAEQVRPSGLPLVRPHPLRLDHRGVVAGAQSWSAVQVTAAIQPRVSSHSRQARCQPGHQRPSCPTRTGRGRNRRFSRTRTGDMRARLGKPRTATVEASGISTRGFSGLQLAEALLQILQVHAGSERYASASSEEGF